MDFDIRIYHTIRITDEIGINITETTVVTWIIMTILIGVSIIVRLRISKWEKNDKPTGFQNIIEMAVESFDKFYTNTAGTKTVAFAPWAFSLFVFLIFANIIGITSLRPPTADWGMTFALATTSLIMFNFAGFKYRPVKYLKSFVEPVFVFLPLNIISEFARPISLSFRLFGNIMGGMILLSLLYGLAPIFARFILPVALHLYFDLVSGLLQAVIFTVLSIVFFSLAAGDD